MSKQVELKGKSLVVRTREDYKSALRVVVQQKDKPAKVFYEITPALLGFTDLEALKDWTICGYRAEELVKLALILRDKQVEDVDLRDYNNCFFDGYKRAQEEIHKQLEESVNRIINGGDIKQ